MSMEKITITQSQVKESIPAEKSKSNLSAYVLAGSLLTAQFLSSDVAHAQNFDKEATKEDIEKQEASFWDSNYEDKKFSQEILNKTIDHEFNSLVIENLKDAETWNQVKGMHVAAFTDPGSLDEARKTGYEEAKQLKNYAEIVQALKNLEETTGIKPEKYEGSKARILFGNFVKDYLGRIAADKVAKEKGLNPEELLRQWHNGRNAVAVQIVEAVMQNVLRARNFDPMLFSDLRQYVKSVVLVSETGLEEKVIPVEDFIQQAREEGLTFNILKQQMEGGLVYVNDLVKLKSPYIRGPRRSFHSEDKLVVPNEQGAEEEFGEAMGRLLKDTKNNELILNRILEDVDVVMVSQGMPTGRIKGRDFLVSVNAFNMKPSFKRFTQEKDGKITVFVNFPN